MPSPTCENKQRTHVIESSVMLGPWLYKGPPGCDRAASLPWFLELNRSEPIEKLTGETVRVKHSESVHQI